MSADSHIGSAGSGCESDALVAAQQPERPISMTARTAKPGRDARNDSLRDADILDDARIQPRHPH
ncbi:hypothetical protein HZY97_20605 [Sphingomonas sp. R-74633]|uniref:hypothetical protein n=1 Tax=Sphingomonas sp. R-74633 TaxID=2751188 RepID=UPI0015D40AE2|nr:hypothetical protein [Sphingomonas sp. R-74633]NYT43187.1 hypothetical protein [Sphingomonas sp. R-74633]